MYFYEKVKYYDFHETIRKITIKQKKNIICIIKNANQLFKITVGSELQINCAIVSYCVHRDVNFILLIGK